MGTFRPQDNLNNKNTDTQLSKIDTYFLAGC